MTRLTTFAVCLLLALPAAVARGQGTPAPDASAWSDSSPHRVYFISGRAIQLQCLDWGGHGPAIVMVHGLGDSPHIFDDLANRLRQHFRVYAYARRGHGRSDAPLAPYDDITLIDDLLQVIDGLRLQRTSLIGWGMGGNEVTAFAGRYPDRVNKIIYLDGGYDWSTSSFFKAFHKIMSVNTPNPAALRSIDSLRVWWHAAWLGSDAPWTNGLEAYLRDVAHLDMYGHVSPVPTPQVYWAVSTTMGTWRREYKKVQAPALALYASTFFPTDRSDPVLAKQLRDFEQNTMVPFRRASIERIQKELRNVKVVEMPNRTHMSIGTEDVDSLAAMIGAFVMGAALPAPGY